MSTNSITILLDATRKFGLSTVLVVVGIMYGVLPLRDGHLHFLDRTATAQESTSGAVKMIAESNKENTGILNQMADQQTKQTEMMRGIVLSQTMILERVSRLERKEDEK